jgi:hypothetical protein
LEKIVNNTTPSRPIGIDGQYLGAAAKKCSKCGDLKPLEGYSWTKKDVKRGNICKPCAALIARKWREDNPEHYKRLQVAQKAQYHANPEPTREKAKQWYQDNQERARESKKAWYEANTDRVAELDRARRANFPEKFTEWNRQWRYNNIERSRYHRRKYKETHKEEVKVVNRARVLRKYDEIVAKQKEWVVANRERVRSISKRWRDKHPGHWNRRKLATVIPLWADHDEIEAVYREADEMAKALGRPVDVDHIYPILGRTVCGLHTQANLRPLDALENRSKGNKLPGHLHHELWETSPRLVYQEKQHA